MADKIIMVDTSILIDYFRKKDKTKTRLVTLSKLFDNFCIASITEFEIYTGTTPAQLDYWDEMLRNCSVLPFDSESARTAATILQDLKKKRKSIEKADLFIAATAVVHNVPLDTLNRKHFEIVEQLILLDASNV